MDCCGRRGATGRADCEVAAADFAFKLPNVADLTLDTAFRLVHRLNLLAHSAFSDPAHWLRAFPFPLGPAYSTLDPARCDALQRGIFLHVVALCDHMLNRDRPLQGAPDAASLRLFLELARLNCNAQLGLHLEERAAADLVRLEADLGPMARDPILLLRERCHLALGNVQAALELRRSRQNDANGEILPMQEWGPWLAAQQARPTVAIDDPAVQGVFASVARSGEVERHAHATVPVRLALAALHEVRLCLSHVLIAPTAGILLPHPWHLGMGEYPWGRVDVLNRAARGAALAASEHWERLEEPRLVLANMDATLHRNFYHWMALILTRILWLDESGDLGRRRLPIPAELSSWMSSCLADLGLAQDRFLPYRQDQHLELAAVLVVSPLEFASPTLIERLRCRFWRAAALDPDHPPPLDRLLYISRRSTNRRSLADEDRIQAMAQELGFEVVAPETLPLLDQVRLFAASRGITGPPGAAFTNLLWMQPGTKVLSIFKDDANLPTFVDLSLIRRKGHRWALGRTLPGFEMEAMVLAPFAVDLELAEDQLGWCAGARDRPLPRPRSTSPALLLAGDKD